MDKTIPLLELKNLKKYYNTPAGPLHAVDGVTLSISKGNTLGVVGESGCGKTTLGRTVLRLIEPTSGEILYKGDDIALINERKMNALRSELQIIFQDPYSSLNPRLTVFDLIADPLIVNRKCDTKEALERRVKELMDMTELSVRFRYAYPHELDGGRRQRIGIARAIALDPEFIVCDEPVSALDVSVQAQILNLMMDLQESLGLTYMFITHNLSVVRHISNEIVVMYLGQCVERAEAKELFDNPLHPYTRALLDAIPIIDINLRGKKRLILEGEVTSQINPAAGCRFAPRCPYAQDKCVGQDIEHKEHRDGHFASCCRISEI